MKQDDIRHIAERFQLAFSTQYRDQIQQVIQESRQEAFARAKQLLKDESLNRLLETMAARPKPDPVATTSTSSPVPHIPANEELKTSVKKRPQASPTKPSTSSKPDPETDGAVFTPALSDRILNEIEAIRAQILRNEQLLSQIKPLLIRSNPSSEDNP